MSSITIQNLGKRYFRNAGGWKKGEAFWALKDLNLAVDQGEVLGIVGANGAGKSTLLKILSRITPPTAGEVTLNGRLASLLEVGTGFHPELTGRDNIFLNGSLLGMRTAEIRHRLEEIVDFSGIGTFLDTPVKHYSSGMYVRLAFSVAAHLQADILLVDEVLAVGDLEFQRRCLGKMNELSKGQGRTVLLVSHNHNSLVKLCDNSIYLREGRLVASGKTREVVDTYHRYLEQQAENVPVNERLERDGSGEAKLMDFRICTPEGETVQRLWGGRPYDVWVRYAAKPGLEIRDLNFRLNIFTPDDHLITTLSNRLSGTDLPLVPREGWARCRVEKWPLMPGKYYFNANLLSGDRKWDKVEKALVFEVEDGDYYGSGEVMMRFKEGVFIEQRWFEPQTGTGPGNAGTP